MTRHSSDRLLDPLPSGTEVGPWRLLSHRGGGFNGLVYRAEPVGPAQEGLFALKLATLVGDERFEREAALLSRISHPNVPRLRDSGVWIFPNGAPLPYLVMDWVEGVTLYDWAAQPSRTSRQVPRVLAQLARALEAAHQAGCVHRDVKGDNVLVSPEGRAFLTATSRPRSCWHKVYATAEKCRENGYEYRGGCYRLSYPPLRLSQAIGP